MGELAKRISSHAEPMKIVREVNSRTSPHLRGPLDARTALRGQRPQHGAVAPGFDWAAGSVHLALQVDRAYGEASSEAP